jgi:hypothetical protein
MPPDTRLTSTALHFAPPPSLRPHSNLAGGRRVCTACHENFGLVNGACVHKTTAWHNGKRLA